MILNSNAKQQRPHHVNIVPAAAASLRPVTKCNSSLCKLILKVKRKKWNRLMPGRKELSPKATVVRFQKRSWLHLFYVWFLLKGCRELTAEGPSWNPWTVIRTVSPTLALSGFVDSLGPLGAAGRTVKKHVWLLLYQLSDILLTFNVNMAACKKTPTSSECY